MHSLIESPRNVLAIHLTGTLTKDDVKAYEELIDERIAADEVFGLVIDMSGFDDITAEAMKEDLKYEASLLGKLWHFPKMALISDKRWINSLVQMAGHLVPGVEVKCFPAGERTAALHFASDLPDENKKETSGITEIPCDVPGLLAFEIQGKVTKHELEPYARHLHTAFETLGQIDLLVRLHHFTGYDPAIFGEKSLYELKREALKHVRRYAVVGAKPWMHGMIKLVQPFVKMEVRTFDLEEEEEAWKWLRS